MVVASQSIRSHRQRASLRLGKAESNADYSAHIRQDAARVNAQRRMTLKITHAGMIPLLQPCMECGVDNRLHTFGTGEPRRGTPCESEESMY